MSEGVAFAIGLEEHVSEPAAKAGHAMHELKGHLEEGKSALEKASLGFLKVVEPAEVAHKAVEQFAEGIKGIGEGLMHADIGHVIEGVTETVAGLAQALDLVVPGLGQVASAAIKMVGALTGGFAEIIEKGVDMALEITSVNDKLEKTFDALGTLGPESGKKTLKMLDELSTALPQSSHQLAEWTKTFEAMGVQDLGELRHQITATASAQAIMGDKGAETYTALTKKVQAAVEAHHGLKIGEKALTKLYAAGVNVTDVADRMGISTKQLTSQLKAGTADAQKFGNALSATLIQKGKGPLEAMNDEMSTLKTKGMETLGHLFDGIDTKPIIDGLKALIGLGDQAEPSGKALKHGLTSAMNAVIKSIGNALRTAKLFFLDLEIMGLQAYISMKPVIDAFKQIKDLLPEGKKNDPNAWRQPQSKGEAIGSTAGVLAKSRALGYLNPVIGATSLIAPFLRSSAQATARRQISANAIGNVSGGNGASFGGVPAETKNETHVTVHEVHVHAKEGVTDANQLSATGLSSALERLQLSSGR